MEFLHIEYKDGGVLDINVQQIISVRRITDTREVAYVVSVSDGNVVPFNIKDVASITSKDRHLEALFNGLVPANIGELPDDTDDCSTIKIDSANLKFVSANLKLDSAEIYLLIEAIEYWVSSNDILPVYSNLNERLEDLILRIKNAATT